MCVCVCLYMCVSLLLLPGSDEDGTEIFNLLLGKHLALIVYNLFNARSLLQGL